MTQPTERISVRIAVAVDRQGVWCALGHCADESSAQSIQTALDYLSPEEPRLRHVVWVTAEVPLPAGQSRADQAVAGIVEAASATGE